MLFFGDSIPQPDRWTRPLLRALRNCRIADGPWLGAAGSAEPTKLAGVRSGIGVGDRESLSVVMRDGVKVFFLVVSNLH